LSSGMEHRSRTNRVVERAEWNRMNAPADTQILNEGYRTLAQELAAQNEKELQSKSSAMGRAATTAFLLRELYEANVDAAQGKIVADSRNSDNVPYVAPGIREIVGFHRFTREGGFPPDAGYGWLALELTVLFWQFPRNILMVVTNAAGQRIAVRNWD